MKTLATLLAALALVACRAEPGLKPFTSDGCSLFPDASLIGEADWCSCCLEHDVHYWRGGTQQEREAADERLRACVLQKTGDKVLAEAMYRGVRVGGSPHFYNWYRWGYGWPYQRGYKPLTLAEQSTADDLLADYRASSDELVCK